MRKLLSFITSASLTLVAVAAHAGTLTVDFGGVPDATEVGSYYASDGLSFGDSLYADVSKVLGGSGNTLNVPNTTQTTMYLYSATGAVLTPAETTLTSTTEFDSLSFVYSAYKVPFESNPYGTLLLENGSTLVEKLTLDYNEPFQSTLNTEFNTWTPVSTGVLPEFNTIVFEAPNGHYDNIAFTNFGLGTPATPSPAALIPFIAGLVGVAKRRRSA